MKLICSLLAFLICATFCADVHGQKLDTVSLDLGYEVQFQFAGYIAAYEYGFYRDVGLEVKFNTSDGEPYMGSETLDEFDYFVGNGSQFLALDRPNEMILVAPIFQHSPLSLVARRDLGIKYLKDLEGRRIGTGAENMAMLISAGVNLDSTINVGPTAKFELLETGKLDAISRFINDSALDRDKYVYFKPLDYGLDFYGECLITNQNELTNHPERLEKMYTATLKGWQYAVDHPQELIDIIREKYNNQLSEEALIRESNVVINSLVLPNLFPIGYNNKAKWVNMEAVSKQFNLLEGDIDWDNILYSEIRTRKQGLSEEYLDILKIVGLGVAIVLLFLITYGIILQLAVNRRTLLLQSANRDINSQNKLLAAQKQELENLNIFKNKMLAVISHDIRGPLGNMDSLFALVKDSHLSEKEFKELINVLHDRVREVSGFLLNILMWAKSQMNGFTSNPEILNPYDLVNETASVFLSEIEKKELRLVNNIDADTQVLADPSLASLIVRNLLTNAIKFSNDGMQIIVSAEHKDDHLKLSIIDEGQGISQERQAMLLQGAVQNDPNSKPEISTGLGLMLCKEFVDLQKGQLGIQSEEGKGTTVWFTLPLSKPSNNPDLLTQ